MTAIQKCVAKTRIILFVDSSKKSSRCFERTLNSLINRPILTLFECSLVNEVRRSTVQFTLKTLDRSLFVATKTQRDRTIVISEGKVKEDVLLVIHQQLLTHVADGYIFEKPSQLIPYPIGGVALSSNTMPLHLTPEFVRVRGYWLAEGSVADSTIAIRHIDRIALHSPTKCRCSLIMFPASLLFWLSEKPCYSAVRASRIADGLLLEDYVLANSPKTAIGLLNNSPATETLRRLKWLNEQDLGAGLRAPQLSWCNNDSLHSSPYSRAILLPILPSLRAFLLEQIEQHWLTVKAFGVDWVDIHLPNGSTARLPQSFWAPVSEVLSTALVAFSQSSGIMKPQCILDVLDEKESEN